MISVCIANRGETLGLWATVSACEAQLANTRHEYCIVTNGRAVDEPLKLLIEHSCAKHLHSPKELPPPMARNAAATMASGHTFVFLDDHVIPGSMWFARMLRIGFPEIPADSVVHSSYTTFPGGPRYYGYGQFDWQTFKGDYTREPQSIAEPYRISVGNHGGFACARKVWEKVGGFGDFWQGFGGEEPYFSIAAQMAGFEVWMQPTAMFYHYSVRDEVRGYTREINWNNYKMARERLVSCDSKRFEQVRASFDGIRQSVGGV